MKDGGPAFPTEYWETGYEAQPFMPHPGMTLRDWFAGMALNGALRKSRIGSPDPKDTARWAYYVADAMLAEKERREKVNRETVS